jgi:hypothetical protein
MTRHCCGGKRPKELGQARTCPMKEPGAELASSWVDRPGRPDQEAGESRGDHGQCPYSTAHASQSPTPSTMQVGKTRQVEH